MDPNKSYEFLFADLNNGYILLYLVHIIVSIAVTNTQTNTLTNFLGTYIFWVPQNNRNDEKALIF